MLSIRVGKEEILVGKIIWADRKLEDTVSRKLLTSSDESYLNSLILKSANKNICREDSFKSLRNQGKYNCY